MTEIIKNKSDVFNKTKELLEKINNGEISQETKQSLKKIQENHKNLNQDEKNRLSDLAEIILERKEKNKESLPAKYEEIISVIEEIGELDGIRGDFIKITNESFEKALAKVGFNFSKLLNSQQS